MSCRLVVFLCAITLIAGCSRDPERPSASSPTGPSASGPAPGSLLGPTSVAPGGVSGKFDVAFPPRNDSFDFRNQLETKYQTGLGRTAAPTYVDREGEVVWTQEYMRYRTNGCDHPTATQRVMTQIDGQPAGQVCGAPPDGLIAFPPRTDSFDFRQQLEGKYETFGRGFSQSTVDAEGGVIWTQEYLRYRVNQCDHPTSVQKVFTQIDGGGVQPTCFVPPCIFTVTPTTQTIPPGGGTFTAVITRTSGTDCTFGAESLGSFVSLVSGTAGSGETTTLTYTVAPNDTGAARSTQIRVRWTNNSTLLVINQDPGGFVLTDPASQTGPTTICNIRGAATQCVLTATDPGAGTTTYTWTVTYGYGTTITHTGTGSSFTFTQACGGPGATASGADATLNVTLTVTDANGTRTYQSGSGGQPPLIIRFFTC